MAPLPIILTANLSVKSNQKANEYKNDFYINVLIKKFIKNITLLQELAIT